MPYSEAESDVRIGVIQESIGEYYGRLVNPRRPVSLECLPAPGPPLRRDPNSVLLDGVFVVRHRDFMCIWLHLLWLLLDDGAGETLRIGSELVISRRHPADREHVGDDIDVLFVGQRARIAFWHRRPRVFE